MTKKELWAKAAELVEIKRLSAPVTGKEGPDDPPEAV
jgi:hypothetical protein